MRWLAELALAKMAEKRWKIETVKTRDQSLVISPKLMELRQIIGDGFRPLVQTAPGWVARIVGKGDKVTEVAISPSLASRLLAYAYNQGIERDQRFFPITSTRVWQIVDRAFDAAGIRKPEHVGTVHVLRHSGAIARLAATGNPKAVQDQLRHKDARMTLRYLKTLSTQESLKIQQGVDFQW